MGNVVVIEDGMPIPPEYVEMDTWTPLMGALLVCGIVVPMDIADDPYWCVHMAMGNSFLPGKADRIVQQWYKQPNAPARVKPKDFLAWCFMQKIDLSARYDPLRHERLPDVDVFGEPIPENLKFGYLFGQAKTSSVPASSTGRDIVSRASSVSEITEDLIGGSQVPVISDQLVSATKANIGLVAPAKKPRGDDAMGKLIKTVMAKHELDANSYDAVWNVLLKYADMEEPPPPICGVLNKAIRKGKKEKRIRHIAWDGPNGQKSFSYNALVKRMNPAARGKG